MNCSYHLTSAILFILSNALNLKVARNTCEKNGFEHDIVDYNRVLKGKECHSGTQK